MSKTTQQKHEGVMPREIFVEEDTLLRVLGPKDASKFFDILEDNLDVRDFITWMRDLDTEEKVRSKLQDFQEHKALRYGIICKDQLAGYVGMWRDPDEGRFIQYNVGYFLDKTSRGKGVVGKSLNRLLSEAELNLDVGRFSAWVEVGNESSANVLVRLGFKKDKQYQGKDGRLNWDYIREANRG